MRPYFFRPGEPWLTVPAKKTPGTRGALEERRLEGDAALQRGPHPKSPQVPEGSGETGGRDNVVHLEDDLAGRRGAPGPHLPSRVRPLDAEDRAVQD